MLKLLYLEEFFIWYSYFMTDKELLARAIALAESSPEPIGCGTVIVSDNKIIAETFNSQTLDGIAINHAEIKAVVMANTKLGVRKLQNAVAYCSCEPCAMCLVALSYANISRIVFNKTMKDLFPDDPQAKFNSYEFVKTLNFTPKLEQLV